MTNRVLLSGSTGFIGQQILQVLKASGIDTRLIIRSDRMKQAPSNTNATLYTQNLFSENSKWLNQACEGIDTIIHCAWYVEHQQFWNSVQIPKNFSFGFFSSHFSGSLTLSEKAIS